MKKGERVFCVICMGLSLWLILESRQFSFTSKFGPGPGFLPFWLGIVLGVISIFKFADTCRKKNEGEGNEPRLPGWKSLLRVGLIMMIMGGFALVMNSLGFILTVFLFVSALLFVLEGDGVLKSMFYGVMFSAFVFLVFRYWLEIDLPKGLLGI